MKQEHFIIKEDNQVYWLREVPELKFWPEGTPMHEDNHKALKNADAVLCSEQEYVIKLIYGKCGFGNDGRPMNYYQWFDNANRNESIYTLTGYKVEINIGCNGGCNNFYKEASELLKCHDHGCQNSVAVISPIEPEENKTMKDMPNPENFETEEEWFKACKEARETKSDKPDPRDRTIEQLKTERRTYEKQYHGLIDENNELKAKVYDLESQLLKAKELLKVALTPVKDHWCSDYDKTEQEIESFLSDTKQ